MRNSFFGISIGIPFFISKFCLHFSQISSFLSFEMLRLALQSGHASMSRNCLVIVFSIFLWNIFFVLISFGFVVREQQGFYTDLLICLFDD